MDKQIERRKEDREKAAQVLDCPEFYLEYFAWPQAFGSTAGPFGGLGGQAVTNFTLEVWSDGKDAAVFCNGKFLKVVEKFRLPFGKILFTTLYGRKCIKIDKMLK